MTNTNTNLKKFEKFECLKDWYYELESDYNWQQKWLANRLKEEPDYDTKYQDKCIEKCKFKMEFIENCLNEMLK